MEPKKKTPKIPEMPAITRLSANKKKKIYNFRIPDNEIFDLALRSRNGDELASRRLMKAVSSYIHSKATRYSKMFRWASHADLYGDGVVGVTNALKKSNPDSGEKFSHFLQIKIKGAILDGIVHRMEQNGFSRRLYLQKKRLKIATEELTYTLGRQPTDEELCAQTGFSPRVLKNTQTRTNCDHSILAVSMDVDSNEEHLPLHERIEDKASANPFAQLAEKESSVALGRIMDAVLDDKERRVLDLYFGRNGESPHVASEIAKLLNVTDVRVIQIKNEALNKLRSPELANDLTELMTCSSAEY